MRVLGNRVLVSRIEDKAVTSSIIEVVSDTKEPGQYALVVATGPGQRTEGGKFIPIDCKAGDMVILKKYAGLTVKLKNKAGQMEEMQLVPAEDVLAVVVM